MADEEKTSDDEKDTLLFLKLGDFVGLVVSDGQKFWLGCFGVDHLLVASSIAGELLSVLSAIAMPVVKTTKDAISPVNVKAWLMNWLHRGHPCRTALFSVFGRSARMGSSVTW